MSVSKKLQDVLRENGISYEVINHAETFTAQETAAADKISGKEMAKVVIVKAHGEDVMIVIPANRMLDLEKVGKKLDASDVRIEDEDEFTRLFPDCDKGAMPPIGTLFDIPCYVDESVLQEPVVCFNAGTHTESIIISTDAYQKIASAQIGDFIQA